MSDRLYDFAGLAASLEEALAGVLGEAGGEAAGEGAAVRPRRPRPPSSRCRRGASRAT